MTEPEIKILSFEESAAKYGSNPMAINTPPAAAPAPMAAPVPGEPIKEPSTEGLTPAPAPEPIKNAFPQPKEILGEGFESWDEVKHGLTRLKELEPKFTEIENKVKEYTPADPYVAELNAALKKGISRESFNQFYSSDPEKLKPEEKVSMMYQLRDGLSKEDADFLVADRFKLDEDIRSVYEPDSRELKLAEISLKQEALIADNEIGRIRSELMASPFEKAIEQRTQEFAPIVPSIMEEVSTVKAGDFSFPVSKETISAVNEHINSLLSSDMLDMERATPENVSKIKEIARGQVIAREFDNIMKFVASEYDKKVLTEKVNPRPASGIEPPPSKMSEIDRQKAMVAAFNNFG